MQHIKMKMEQTINALHGAATGIASAIEDESANADQVYALLEVIASQMQNIADQMDGLNKS